jgi:hypothetical protein
MSTPVTELKGSNQSEEENSVPAPELSHDKTPPGSANFGEAPDGGAIAWLVCGWGFCHYLLLPGFLELIWHF